MDPIATRCEFRGDGVVLAADRWDPPTRDDNGVDIDRKGGWCCCCTAEGRPGTPGATPAVTWRRTAGPPSLWMRVVMGGTVNGHRTGGTTASMRWSRI